MDLYQWHGKVYFADTDAAGVVHHSQYLRYLEAARIDFFEYLGYPYELMQLEGVGFVPVSIDSTYIKPLVFSDRFLISTSFIKIKRMSVLIRQTVLIDSEKYFLALVKLACMNEKIWQVIQIPDKVKRLMLSYMDLT